MTDEEILARASLIVEKAAIMLRDRADAAQAKYGAYPEDPMIRELTDTCDRMKKALWSLDDARKVKTILAKFDYEASIHYGLKLSNRRRETGEGRD